MLNAAGYDDVFVDCKSLFFSSCYAFELLEQYHTLELSIPDFLIRFDWILIDLTPLLLLIVGTQFFFLLCNTYFFLLR